MRNKRQKGNDQGQITKLKNKIKKLEKEQFDIANEINRLNIQFDLVSSELSDCQDKLIERLIDEVETTKGEFQEMINRLP